MSNFNAYNPTQQSYQQIYSSGQYFLPSQGSVYMINNSLEVANVPMGAGISVALCPTEEIMYLKSIQNGAPCMVAYKILPYEVKSAPVKDNSDLELRLKKLEESLEGLRKQFTGGKISELL